MVKRHQHPAVEPQGPLFAASLLSPARAGTGSSQPPALLRPGHPEPHDLRGRSSDNNRNNLWERNLGMNPTSLKYKKSLRGRERHRLCTSSPPAAAAASER